MLLEVSPAFVLDRAHLGRVGVDHRSGERLPERTRQVVVQPADLVGVGTERSAFLGGELRVVDLDHPLRRPLEQAEVRHPLDEGRGDLHRRGPGADHTDPPAVEGNRMIPTGAVEHGAPERLDALESGDVGVVQHAGGGDHNVGVVTATGGGGQAPPTVGELARRDLLAEVHDVTDAPPGCHAFEVGLDLVTGREAVGPLGVRFERVGVGVRRHVTGDAGVGVLAPRAADPVGLLVDDHVVVARFVQLDGGEDPRHARSDDGEPHRSCSSRCSGRIRAGSDPGPDIVEKWRESTTTGDGRR